MKDEKRFSKGTLTTFVLARIDELRKEHGFESANGWEQVRGKGEDVNRAYGEWDALNRMADRFELEEP